MHKVGDTYIWLGAQITVIGGPNLIKRDYSVSGGSWSAALFTVRAGDREFSLQTDRFIRIPAGQTRVVLSKDLDKLLRHRQRNVIEAFCPSCDEPDMIFYSEDYICAWCREHLEDF